MMRDEHAAIPTAAALSEDEQNRLAQILDDYLVAVERGAPIAPAELLERHPADADYLRVYLSGLQLFHAAAGGGADPAGARARASLQLDARPTGRTIGEFEIIREIGRGGMGVVYEAEQRSLRRRVALKVLPFSAANDAKQIGRFKNEAQAAAQVQHPHIVPVFAVGEADGVHYFAMQLIDGESLASLIAGAQGYVAKPRGEITTFRNATSTRANLDPTGSPQRSLPAMPAMPTMPRATPSAFDSAGAAERTLTVGRFGRQAAEALHAAHEYGVIHRDVKPSNLLVDRQGKLWVADFGLARCREGANLTNTGDVCGTMRYMSPEQALGQASLVDDRTDVYSLGVTLYELATGHHPAEDAGDMRQFFDRSSFPYKPLRHWDRRIPVDFETILMKAISEARGDRYSTARDMADDLGRFLAGEPILATPPTRLTRVRKWAGRHRKAVGAAVILLVVCTAGLLAGLSYVAGANATVTQARRDARESNQMTSDLLYDVALSTAEQLAAIPGTEGVRRQMLENSLACYVRLGEQANGDLALGADLALAYSKIGGLAAMMGDREKALAAHRDARRILEELVAQQPANVAYARSLALCRNNAGMVLAELGRSDEAVDELAAGRELQENLHARRPHEDLIATDLATTYSNLGLVAKQRGHGEEAARWFRAGVALQEQLLPWAADDETLLRSLAASYNNLGSLDEAADGVAAIEAYQHAIDLQRTLVGRQPLNQLYQAELARTYNNLGFAAALRRDWPTAQRAYGDAILPQTNLVKNSPLTLSHRRDLAITYNNQGMALSEIGRLDEAADSFASALAEQRRLLAALPGDAATLSNLGGIYNNRGMLLDCQGRLGDAADAYRQAIRYQRHAFDDQPQNAATRELLSKHYFNYASNLQRQGKFAAALDVARQRKELWRDEPDRLLAASRALEEIERLVSSSDAAGHVN